MRTQHAANSGKLVVEAEKSLWLQRPKAIINDFSTIIMRGDKIGS